MQNLKMYELIYITGSGRSGSTLLERMLHSSPEVFALGEFHCLWRMATEAIACSCGRTFACDPFWQRVCARAGLDAVMIDELRGLEARISRTSFVARHRFSLQRLRSDAQVARFLDLQHRLFSAIAEETGARVLVDSSKAGPRAWLLATDPRVRVIHLYRDPVEVLASWRSRKFDPGLGTDMQRPPIRTALGDWWKAEQFARLLGARRLVARIDYARLCSVPRHQFEAMAGELGLSAPLAPQWIAPDSFAQRSDYHSLNGNPDRFDRGPVKVQRRQVQWNGVPKIERPAIRMVAGVLRALFSPPRNNTGQP